MLALLVGNMLCMGSVLASPVYYYWYGTSDGQPTWEKTNANTSNMKLDIYDDTYAKEDSEHSKPASDIQSFFGGFSDGSDNVENNIVNIYKVSFTSSGGILVYNGICGGYTIDGNAVGNCIKFNDVITGKIGSIYAGETTSGTASNNLVQINAKGSFNCDYIAGGNGDIALENTAEINANIDGMQVWGGDGFSQSIKNNVIINLNCNNSSVAGAFLSKGFAKENKVEITVNGSVTGGKVFGATGDDEVEVIQNEVIINGNVSGGAIICGAETSENGSINENKVEINGNVSGATICGGRLGRVGRVNQNKVDINGSVSNVDVYGGLNYGDYYDHEETFEAKNNIVNINSENLSGTINLYGGKTPDYGISAGNTLNVNAALTNKINTVEFFQNINFKLPDGSTTETIMMKAINTVSLSGVEVSATNLPTLTGNEYITLIQNVDDTDFAPPNEKYQILEIGGVKELVYTNGTATPKGDYGIKQGSSKLDSGISTSTYTGDAIQGNTSEGGLSATSYSGNEIYVRRGTYEKDIYGANNNVDSTTVENNKVEIIDGIFNASSEDINIIGGSGTNSTANTNSVIIDGGTYTGTNGHSVDIKGGAGGTDSGNSVTVNGGNFKKVKIAGGSSQTSQGDKVVIKNGNFEDTEIYGAKSIMTNQNQQVVVEGGSYTNTKIVAADGEMGVFQNNSITVTGTNNLDLSGATLMGYENSGRAAGATLNVQRSNIATKDIKNFGTMNFALPSNIANGDTVVSANAVTFDSTKICVTAPNGYSLSSGDIVKIIAATSIAGEFSVDKIFGETAIEVTAGQEYTTDVAKITLDGNNIVLEILQSDDPPIPSPVIAGGNEDKQKAPVEGIAATVAMVNQSADLAMGDGMKSLLENTDGPQVQKTNLSADEQNDETETDNYAERNEKVEPFTHTDTFGALTATRSKYQTGSHVDMDGWGALVGVGQTKGHKDGGKTSYGLFFEYGKGDFDTYNEDIHGEGDSNNKGVGIMARRTLKNDTYFDVSVRYGKQETEWSESDIGGYDTDSKYYGAAVALGHHYPIGKDTMDVYVRYSYGHTGACDAKVKDSEYHFDGVDSSRLRFGINYNFEWNKKVKPYLGLAWERELKGESHATIAGVGEAPAPSLKGNTGILPFGIDWETGNWLLGLGGEAYVGKRKGISGTAKAFYNF